VGFRYSTVGVARDLGLRGWARNLTTGEVEVLASGTSDALEQLEKWLHRGPSSARVSDIAAISVPYREFSTFSEVADADRPDTFAG
jgi:acylphosphatase